MAKSNKEVIYEGWLTKSPPTKRIWRARWRRRWFSLSYSGEIPGQCVLNYYADRNCRKLKGIINLDNCEQVDLGLKLEDRKLKFDHVFDIKTPTRTYYLAADTEDDMKAWVNYICKVCSLKSTNDEQDYEIPMHITENTANYPDVICTESNRTSNETVITTSTPPVSPVSTSPYIPISECFTGSLPIHDPKDCHMLIQQQNYKNSLKRADSPSRVYVNDKTDPLFYDSPRQLAPINKYTHQSPLQSPTDTESVFTDEDMSTCDLEPIKIDHDDLIATRKFTKDKQSIILTPPPRPPKNIPISITTTYLNLGIIKKDDNDEKKIATDGQKLITDEMYDFPRSHQVDNEPISNNASTIIRKHCYSNAAPSKMEKQIFKYDLSPKPGPSAPQIFRYDLDETADEPASPLSQCSSTNLPYTNLPSPLLIETQLMSPPVINRDLKPKRKLSDSLSMTSNPEPTSPRLLTNTNERSKFNPDNLMRSTFLSIDSDMDNRRIRAAPSPTPPTSAQTTTISFMGIDTDDTIYRHLPCKMQYLDLDLDCNSSNDTPSTSTSFMVGGGGGAVGNGGGDMKSPISNTDYKDIDFVKTGALIIARKNLEKERMEAPKKNNFNAGA